MENTNTQAPDKKKSKKKWIIIAIVAVLVVAVLGSSGDTPTNTSSPEQTISENASHSSDTTTVATEQSNSIKVGSDVSTKQIKIIYKSCNTDFVDYSAYADIKDGHKIIEAVFDFENISNTDVYISGFECYADGSKCDDFFYVDDYTSPYNSISPSRKLTDVAVYYQVPENAEKIEIEYEANVWSGEKFIFTVE